MQLASTSRPQPGGQPATTYRSGDGNDPRLVPWLTADGEVAAAAELVRLLTDEAGVVIDGILGRKFGADRNNPDAADVASEVRLQLVRYLRRLREEGASTAVSSVGDFRAFVSVLTYKIWATHLRRRHPARAMLVNRLRYLLGGQTAARGFALWPGPSGERLAGFASWRDQGRVSGITPRSQWLALDPVVAVAEAFGGQAKIPSDLAELTAGLFVWLGGPVELRILASATAAVLKPVAAPTVAAEEPDAEPTPVDPSPLPPECLQWKEYLSWLWQEAARLSLRQRTAFLLHSSLLREMELLALANVRSAAAVLGLPPERMAVLWVRLPLPDLEIAALLGASGQQVINLRQVARNTLGQAWQKWSKG